MILNGTMQWEFRENPRFGILSDKELTVGDILFIVSTFQDAAISPGINCMCRVLSILHGQSFSEYFGDFDSGHWKEAGYNENIEQDWNYFVNNILNKYKTAIQLDPFPVSPFIDLKVVKHKTRHISWKGIGFTPIDDLKRFVVGMETIKHYFEGIANEILTERKNLPE